MIPELETADLEAILAPLAGEQPTGVDLREDYAPNSIYFRLRDARAGARDAERQAETEGGDEGLPALWRPPKPPMCRSVVASVTGCSKNAQCPAPQTTAASTCFASRSE